MKRAVHTIGHCGRALALLLVIAAWSARAEAQTVAKAKADYTVAVEKIEAEFKQGTETALVKYAETLEEAAARTRSSGDLDGVIALGKEKERFAKEKSVPRDSPEGTQPIVARIRTAYWKYMAQLERNRDSKAVDLLSAYLRSLDELKKACVRDGRIADAVAVKQEIDKSEFAMAELRVKVPKAAPVDEFPTASGIPDTAPGKGLPPQLRKGMVLNLTFDLKDAGAEAKDGSGKRQAVDKSGQNNHGVVIDASYTPEGRSGGAYLLDGNNDHITIPNTASIEVREGLTVATWVNLESLGPGGYANEAGYIVNKGDDLWWNPTFYLGFGKGDGTAIFHVCNEGDPQNGGGKTVSSVTKLAPKQWYHLAGTYDGKTVKFYVNGQLESDQAYSGLLRSDKAPVHIGGGKLFGTDWGNHFTVNGVVDEVCMWNRALSAQDIRAVCTMVPRRASVRQ